MTDSRTPPTAPAEDERACRAYLNLVAPGCDPVINRAIGECGGIAGAAGAIAGLGIALPGSLVARVRALGGRDGIGRAARLAAAQGRRGVRFICPGDAEWPASLERAFRFAALGVGDRAGECADTAHRPVGLWVAGAALATGCRAAITVTGSRRITDYGHDTTRRLVGGLSRHGVAIASGAMPGIGHLAVSAALAAPARPAHPAVMVLAGGHDSIGDHRTRRLAGQVRACGGTVVTEYPPGTPASFARMLARNRLAAALARGTVVVEAPEACVALNTLRWAGIVGSVAMAVPGPAGSRWSTGCHRAIAEGAAQLVTDWRGIAELTGVADDHPRYHGVCGHTGDRSGVPGEYSREELAVLSVIGTQPLTYRTVCAATYLPPAQVTRALVNLHARGEVDCHGVWWARPGSVTDRATTAGGGCGSRSNPIALGRQT